MIDDFSDVPQSIAEIRAFRSNKASEAIPRDNLVSLLRDIDSGESNPNVMIVLWMEKDDPSVRWIIASPNRFTTVGMLACALHEVQVS